MSKRFDKFKYQLVQSTEKGYQEVVVTFNYKDKTCHYYSFIREKSGVKASYYVNETKANIAKMIKNGKLERHAKRYLNYKVEEPVFGGNKGRKKRPYIKFLLLIILGVLLVAGAVCAYLYRADIIKWPESTWTDQERYLATVLYYSSISAFAAGIAALGAGIPLLLIKSKKNK